MLDVRVALVVAVALVMWPAAALSQDHRSPWRFEFMLGSAAQFSNTMTIRQNLAERIVFEADYETRAFEFPLYYALRVSKWQRGRGWGVELIHHKVHVRNLPPEVQAFEITHGYNLLTVSHSWASGPVNFGFAAGLVIAHPESTVRGRAYQGDGGSLPFGYDLSGPTGAAFVNKRFAINELWFASAELRVTGAWATVPVEDGSAEVPNNALHVLIGIGRGGRE